MDVFYALAEPRRRKIVELLAASGQLSATEIYRKFDVTAQAISQHLAVLREARIVLMDKRAQRHIYRLNTDSVLEMEEWVKRMEKLWNARFDRLEILLEQEKGKNAKNR